MSALSKVFNHHLSGFVSLNIQEDDDACDVVDGRVLFLPSFEGLPYERFSSLLSAIVLVVRHNDVNSLIVRDKLPDTITCKNHELISLKQIHFSYFWDGVHADFSGRLITEASGHGQARNVLVQMPHASWTQRVTLHVSVGSDTAASVEDSSLFIRLVSFMVPVQRYAEHFKVLLTICGACNLFLTS